MSRGPAGTSRVLEVSPERRAAWLAGFAQRHGPTRADGALITAADGSSALVEPFDHDPVGVILVRRGGYAVGLAHAGRFTTSKVGSRHVQSRTAAGGWSQQRFARRRANQADALVEAVAAHALRVLLGGDADGAVQGIPAGLVLGGDRTLVAAVLAERPLRVLVGLPRREFPGLPDPGREVLAVALCRGRATRITLSEPSGRPVATDEAVQDGPG